MIKNLHPTLIFSVIMAVVSTVVAHTEEKEDKTLYIYQDADLAHHKESSTAIQSGIELAFDEIDNTVAGYKIAFKYLDHRGNVVRSKRNYDTFLTDPQALAIYSGIHSPPLIKNLEFINKNKALTLVPWAAGGPVTRYPSTENWVFRLSVDDTRAAKTLINFAVKNKQCTAPHLLLENTPWGDSNLKNMSQALKEHAISEPEVTRFGWNLSPKSAKILLRRIAREGSNCILLVGNAIEGVTLARAMVSLPPKNRLPIISHWGITGGDFHKKVTAEARQKLDLTFIQTCFAFTNKQQSPLAQKVFNRLKTYSNGNIQTPIDLKPAVGFIHAYDLTKLLIQAMQQSTLTGDIKQDRNTIRLALEDLQKPVTGLVKTYDKPFSVFNAQANPNAHEALHQKDYCMGKFGPENGIHLLGRT